jgi:hypothetical protein
MRGGALLLSTCCLAAAAGCKPDLGAPESLVTGPRIIGVRGLPPEAAPGAMVAYDMFAVDVTGTVAAPDVGWAQCLTPAPPALANDVSDQCLTVKDDSPSPAPTFSAALPSNACSLFGPQTPPVMKGQPPVRPADPDTTGGYYQPVRAVWQSTGLIAFALERITCRLANAPATAANDYASMYTANKNPVLADLVVGSTAGATVVYTAGQSGGAQPGAVTAGEKVVLQGDFSDDSAETFLVWDLVAQQLVQQRESLRVSWYATGGAFEHDVTGRGSDDPTTYTQNNWVAPTTSGRVHLWAVLRDSRGGIDFAAAEIDVTP